MTKTEKWLADNKISQAEASKAGLLPSQRMNRLKSACVVLKNSGLENTQEYKAFAKVI